MQADKPSKVGLAWTWLVQRRKAVAAGVVGTGALGFGVNSILEPLIHDPAGIRIAQDSQYKWHIRLTSDGPECGGAVIEDDWIVTAAHCVSKPFRTGSKVIVHAGVKYREGAPNEVAVRLVLHSNYEKAASTNVPNKNDIALIKVPLELGQTIEKIDVIPENDEGSIVDAHVAGWVCIPPVQGFVEAVMTLFTDCGDHLYHTAVKRSEICRWGPMYVCAGGNVGTELPGLDANDSGGGLATGTETGAKLLGIALHSGDPSDAYLRVSQYRGWIQACMSGGGAAQKCNAKNYPFPPEH